MPAGGIVDLHAHVLPGIDDGPRDAAAAAALLEALARQGVEVVVATPHVSDTFPTTPAEIAAGLAAIAGLPGPRVLRGAEVHPAALDRVLGGDPSDYALADSGVLLVEAEPAVPAELLDAARRLLARAGLRTLLAHAERCTALQRRPESAEDLVSAGALLQVTASAWCGDAARPSARSAVALAERGLVGVVASDAHAVDWRAPLLAEAEEALTARYGADVADVWLRENPAALLAGAPLRTLRPVPRVRPRAGLLDRLRRRAPTP